MSAAVSFYRIFMEESDELTLGISVKHSSSAVFSSTKYSVCLMGRKHPSHLEDVSWDIARNLGRVSMSMAEVT